MVEFALVIPILAFVLFAIIQYGLIFNAYMTLRHGAHVTARSISMTGANPADATTIATTAMQGSLVGFDPAKLHVQTPTLITLSLPNDAYQVTLSYDIPIFISFVVPWASENTLTITSQAVYRRM